MRRTTRAANKTSLANCKKQSCIFPFLPPQGCLLLYGTYLAGLTYNVSHPPVNQSPTILTVVTLVTISSAVAVPISIFLQAWPNLVYSAVAGAIFICTIATNCMLFVPQVRRKWCMHLMKQLANALSQCCSLFFGTHKTQLSPCLLVFNDDTETESIIHRQLCGAMLMGQKCH